MTGSSEDPEIELISLRLRVAHFERILIGVFGVGFLILMILNGVAVLLIGKATRIYTDMFDGLALPAITQVVINYGESGVAGYISALVPLGTFVALFLRRDSRTIWYVAVAMLVILFLHWCGIVLGLWLPYVAITSGIGGP